MTDVTDLGAMPADRLTDVADLAFDTARRSTDAVDRARRYGRIEALIGGLAALVVIVALVAVFYFSARNSGRDEDVAHADCVATALVTYAAATGEAFAQPNPQAAIGTAATQLREHVAAC